MTPNPNATYSGENGRENFQEDLIWRHFVEKGVLIEPRVRPIIARSWQRSTKIDPFRNQRSVLPKHQLDLRRTRNQDLIAIAWPVMQEISSLDGKIFVLLCDNEGYVIEKVSNVDCPIPLGAKCREEDIGTNAIGTALIERGPVEIKGYEHYVSRLHGYHCAAVPIRDVSGSIIGVIDVTNPHGDLPAGIMQLLKFAVQLIEHQLCSRQKYHCSEEMIKNLKKLIDLIDNCVVIIDSEGKIAYVNKKFCDILEIENKEKIIGLHYLDFLKFKDKAVFLQNCSPGSLVKLEKDRESLICKVIDVKQIPSCKETDTLLFLEFPKKITSTSADGSDYRFHDIIGRARSWSEIIWRAKKAAQVSSNVLIEGESGTGKELIAQAIHYESGRKGPFLPINCGAIPKELIESELFGYEDGAFTGAKRGGKMGKFEVADGGTLFLDEIGEMPLEMQVHLLRVLQEKKIIRIGGSKPRPVDVRIIAATNRDLREEIKAGRFREDLYFRLNVININLPPLRERKKDIPLLVEHFLERYCRQFHKNITAVDKEVMDILCCYEWPGNVRELCNVIENAVVFTEGNIILPEVIPSFIKEYTPVRYSRGGSLREHEERLIFETLKRYNGNISKTAKALGITRNTVYRKINKQRLN